MPDDIRRIIDRDVDKNLQRFRDSDFEARLRKRLGESRAFHSAGSRRFFPAFACGAVAVMVLAAAVFLSLSRPGGPNVPLGEIEQALHMSPALQAIEAEGRIPGGPELDTPLSRALASALKIMHAPAGEKQAEEPPHVRDSAVASPEDSRRAIQTTIRDRVLERVLIKYSVLAKEV
jgi:hypothetical protein